MLNTWNIPPQWTAALRAVQELASEAVIGGGCLRDLDNDRPVKDIDIFVKGGKIETLFGLHGRMVDLGWYVEDIDPNAQYPVGDGNDVAGYFTIGFLGLQYPVQIIMVDYPFETLLERFDYGICRIMFDGATITTHPDYLADQKNKVFRLCRERNNIELAASVHRYARIVRKYEGWRWMPYVEPWPPVLASCNHLNQAVQA